MKPETQQIIERYERLGLGFVSLNPTYLATYSNNTTNAWNVNLNNGSMNNDNKTNTYYVWLVRAGE